ncbi:MAG: RDD family protein [Clostridium sp.]
MSNNIDNHEVSIDDFVEENLDEVVETKNVKDIKVEAGNLFQKVISNILDQAIVLGCGALLLVVFDFIIRIVGFKVAQGYHTQMLLIMYFITNVLYFSLISNLKDGRTIGKRIMNII